MGKRSVRTRVRARVTAPDRSTRLRASTPPATLASQPRGAGIVARTWQSLRAQPRARQVGWAALGIVVVVAVIAAGVGLGGVLAHSRGAAGTAGTGAQASPTAHAASTATEVATPLNGPTLGGNPHTFDHVYDIPTTSGATTAVYDYTTPNGIQVRLVITSVQGIDGQPHVVLVTFGPPQGAAGWTREIADSIAPGFLPRDAVPQGIAQTPDGPDYLYTSRGLAATFPPGVFITDTSHTAVPPGTFDYLCSTSAALGGAIGLCVMQPGRHQ